MTIFNGEKRIVYFYQHQKKNSIFLWYYPNNIIRVYSISLTEKRNKTSRIMSAISH